MNPSDHRRLPIARFFVIALGTSWLFWLPLAALGRDVWQWPDVLWLYAGGAGPPLAGVVLWWQVAGPAGVRDLGRRLVDVSRISPRWWLVVLLLPVAFNLAGGWLHAFVHDVPLAVDATALRAALDAPPAFFATAAFLFLLGPLPEEIGWRGYAQDALQSRLGPLGASLWLGLAWAAWHAPLFLMNSYYARFGATPEPLLFAYNILLHAVLFTWIFNNTQRSLLAAVLFHFMINFSGEMLPVDPDANGSITLVKTLFVLVVAAQWMRRR